MAFPPYSVQHYPPTLRAKDGRELIAVPLKGEAWCTKCHPGARNQTIVGYRDRRTRQTWPTCWSCAQAAAKLPKAPGD